VGAREGLLVRGPLPRCLGKKKTKRLYKEDGTSEGRGEVALQKKHMTSALGRGGELKKEGGEKSQAIHAYQVRVFQRKENKHLLLKQKDGRPTNTGKQR